MGYDMHWRKKDASEEAAVAAAQEVWDAAIRERNALPRMEGGDWNHAKAEALGDWEAHEAYDGRTERYIAAQDKVMAASAALDAARVSYFRLNIHGMGLWCDIMAELGMTFSAPDHPEWPEVESYGITDDDVDRVKYPEEYGDAEPLDEETREKVLRYIAAQDDVLSWHGPEVPGIPEHKFSSNDGWVVLPAECAAALDIYRRKLDEIGEDAMHNFLDNRTGSRGRGRWAQWLAYLNGAITHDGFEVH